MDKDMKRVAEMTDALRVSERFDRYDSESIVAGDFDFCFALARLLNLAEEDAVPRRYTPVDDVNPVRFPTGVGGDDRPRWERELGETLDASTARDRLKYAPLDQNTFYVLTSATYFVDRARQYWSKLADYKGELERRRELDREYESLLRETATLDARMNAE